MKADAKVDTYFYDSPVGVLELMGDGEGLQAVTFRNEALNSGEIPGSLAECVIELREYFSGKRKVFTVKLNPQGTEFQLRVWKALLEIPFGSVVSYSDIARQVGDVKATRAVGTANGSNPIAIIIPCHRVIGSSGKLVGYGGGIEKKKWLLLHEQATSDSLRLF